MNPQCNEIWKIKLYPVRGSEQDGLRPCVVVSPNSMNKALQTVIIVPLTSSLKDWPTRSTVFVQKQESQACLEHIRSVSKERFIEKLGKVSDVEMAIIRKKLNAIFSV